MLYFSPWKIGSILAVILIGFLFMLPNFVPEQQRLDAAGEPVGIWQTLPHQTVNLGLDLRGGSHLLFQVDMEEVREDQLQNLAGDARAALVEAPLIPATRPAVVGDTVVVRLSRPEDQADALERLEDINEPITNASGGQSFQNRLNITPEPDGRTIRLQITEAAYEAIQQRTIQQSIEVIRRRIDTTGTTEPNIARQGADRVLVQVPGETNPQRIIDLVGTTARMTFNLVESGVTIGPDGQGRTPPGVEILPSEEAGIGSFIAVQSRPIVTGDQLTSASQGYDENGAVAVNFRFNTAGARAFGETTATNRGRLFAIVLDGVVISAPRINEPIMGGSGQITGSYSVQEANDLANMLNAGALPARLTPVEQRTVTASLGQDSIERGQNAIAIGFGLVIVFMVRAYGLFGFYATLALLVNVLLLVGALSGLQATLTLPGIAGIILTIGMAVDANVLIFERIREEYRQGRTVINAIEAGYDRAFAAILDANVTTLIAAGVLFLMGAGPVQGFAVTLGIGIMTSVFTAFVLSRLLVATWVRLARPKTLAI
jgi:preprotein translocase subunit SecD